MLAGFFYPRMSQNAKHKNPSYRGLGLDVLSASQIVDYGAKLGGQGSKISIPDILKNPFKNFNFSPEQFKKFSSLTKKRNLIIFAIFIGIFIVGLVIYKSLTSGSTPLVKGTTQTNFSPQSQTTINRRFDIPIKTAKGDSTPDKLGITLTTVDKAQRILIQGKPATARDTKTFLVINMEIENSTRNQLTVRPVDFVRLIDNENRSFAPDVHNKEVVVEPVSIKKTRVGYVVNNDIKNFKFLIGEINGSKETVEITI